MIFLCVRSLAPYLNGYFNNILLTNFMYIFNIRIYLLTDTNVKSIIKSL